jgi:hypothetical protein
VWGGLYTAVCTVHTECTRQNRFSATPTARPACCRCGRPGLPRAQEGQSKIFEDGKCVGSGGVCGKQRVITASTRVGVFSKKKPVTSASPIWQSADRKGLRRSLVCPTVIISSRWAFRSDGCSARGRAVADAEAGTAFRAIAIRAIAQPHEVND